MCRSTPTGRPGRHGPGRVGTALAVILLGLVGAGCRSGPDASGPVAAPSTTASSGPARSTPPARTTGPPATRPPTPRPTPVDGRCPYASADQIAVTVGQRIGRTTVTRTVPHPGCSFYRPSGERAADIQVTQLGTPVAAQSRAIQLGGRGANPVDNVGDGGVVALSPSGALLAVSKGRALVVVRINQRSSLEAREVAQFVVARL